MYVIKINHELETLANLFFATFHPFSILKLYFLLEKVSLWNLAEKVTKEAKTNIWPRFPALYKKERFKSNWEKVLDSINPFPASMESPRIKYLFNFLFIEYSQNMN